MLSSRSVRTEKGRLAVAVAYPRHYVVAQLARRLTVQAGIMGALSGFAYSSYQHSSGNRPERGAAAVNALGQETAVWGAAGATAGLTGALAYGLIGGPTGVIIGLGGAAIVGGGTFAALPALAASQGQNTPEPETEKTSFYVSLDKDSASAVGVEDTNIEEDKAPPAPAYNGPWNDQVVFLGMNYGPTAKATRLMSQRADVTPILPGKRQDFIRVGKRDFDLRSQNGIANFAAVLGLAPDKTAKVREAFKICEPMAKDELASLALVWAQGERGAKIPSRLVLAGHSNGDGVWGDNNGSLRLGPLLLLSRAMPNATKQIEDAFVTGCYSGGEVTMDQYLLIFPRAKTIWAYEAQAPGVDNGATIDQGGWEAATRGRQSGIIGKASNKGKNLAVWSYVSGYHAKKPPLTLNDLRGKVEWMEDNFFQPAMQGKNYTYDGQWRIPINITDPHTGLVRQYYSWLVRLTQNKDLPEEERALWVAKKHQTIRLLYFADTVAPRFTQNYKGEIQRGYAKLGLNTPDYSRLSRAQALTQINTYLAKLDKTKNAPAEAQKLGDLLERGLKDLDPGVVPDGWV